MPPNDVLHTIETGLAALVASLHGRGQSDLASQVETHLAPTFAALEERIATLETNLNAALERIAGVLGGAASSAAGNPPAGNPTAAAGTAAAAQKTASSGTTSSSS